MGVVDRYLAGYYWLCADMVEPGELPGILRTADKCM